MKYFISKKQIGFTLMELIVVSAVMGIIVVAVISVFINGLSAINRTYSEQNALDSLRFINETIAKELRMSIITTAAGGPYTPYISIDITNQDGADISYTFADNNFIRTEGTDAAVLNSNVVNIISGGFYIQKSETGKPRVTIVMKARTNDGKPTEQAEINIQTTVSSRQYAQ